MTDHMYSAEEASQILGLQVRTIRNYVREGRLPGVRIGKQYRIARADLEAFTAGAGGSRGIAGAGDAELGATAAPGATVGAAVRAEVSSVVQIDGLGPADHDRIERTLAAASTAGMGEDGEPLRIEPLYDEDRQRLRVLIVGPPADCADVLRMLDALTRACRRGSPGDVAGS